MAPNCNRTLFTLIRPGLTKHMPRGVLPQCTELPQQHLYKKCGAVWSQRTHVTAPAAQEPVIEQLPVNPTSSSVGPTPTRREALLHAKPFSHFLTDTYNRQHNYLRISITERCNLRCTYCMPEEGVQLLAKDEYLTPHEIIYLAELFVSQGVDKIRITGGEPTVHPQILTILRGIGALKSKGLKELAITTNGINLFRKLDDLVHAGVTGINLSLDTLDPLQFEKMTRRLGFEAVMRSINRVMDLKRAGVSLKLKTNSVIMSGQNEDQVLPLIEFTRDRDLEVRFIEYMPFGGNKWSEKKMFSYEKMIELIRSRYPTVERVEDHPNNTSKTWKIPGFTGTMGFITSMTEHFCSTCNRLRITSDGNIKACLHENKEVSLRDMMRGAFNHGKPIDEAAFEAMRRTEAGFGAGSGVGENETKLLQLIGKAVGSKQKQHADIGTLEHMENRPMIRTGG